MGKGDGKKKRKKKSSSTTSSSSSSTSSSLSSTASPSTSPAPAPARVTSNSNIPVRHQLMWAKLNKEYRQRQSSSGFRQVKQPKPVRRTSYRRTWEEEELEQKAQERKRKGQDPDWDVILARFHNNTAVKPLVLVDGYNIIYQWARLKKHMVKGDPSRARRLLVDDLEQLASIKGWRIEVVFDGTRRSTVGPLGPGPGSSESSKPNAMDQQTKGFVSKHGVRVMFSGIGREADSYLEARCADAKTVTDGALTGSFIVATDDSMIQMAAQNAGALCMSAGRFVNELKAVKNIMEYRVEAAMAKVNGHAYRPEPLRRRRLQQQQTSTSGSSSSGAQVLPPGRFGRNSILIEDKRNRTNARRRRKEEELLLLQFNDDDDEEEESFLNLTLAEDENGIPWWAQVPTDVNPYRQ